MQCPKCGSQCWDNRSSKRNPKAPDYKCKNRDCNNAIWEQRATQQQPAPASRSSAPAPASGVPGGRPLAPLYFACLKIAKASVDRALVAPASTAHVPYEAYVAAAATLFIQACNRGAPLTTPKAKPAPPPPPPVQEVKPEPEYPEYTDYDYDDALGF